MDTVRLHDSFVSAKVDKHVRPHFIYLLGCRIEAAEVRSVTEVFSAKTFGN